MDEATAPLPSDSPTGVVLIAHGSRRDEANRDLEHVATQLRQRGWQRVVVSYLELCEPDIHSAGAACVAAGARLVVLAPYFLSAGRHVTDDLESARKQLAERFPEVDFRLAAPLGPHPLLSTILEERLGNALGA